MEVTVAIRGSSWRGWDTVEYPEKRQFSICVAKAVTTVTESKVSIAKPKLWWGHGPFSLPWLCIWVESSTHILCCTVQWLGPVFL